MFTLAGIRKFHGWTHASLSLLLDHLSTISPAEYTEELPDFGFPTLRDQMIHICNCEGFWIHTLQGLRYVDRKAEEYPLASDARILLRDLGQKTHNYLSLLTERSLNLEAELHFPDGDVALRTPALVLHHVLTHAFHHKGQIVAMCRALSHPAPDTDLNHFE